MNRRLQNVKSAKHIIVPVDKMQSFFTGKASDMRNRGEIFKRAYDEKSRVIYCCYYSEITQI
jgi:hypothetical protein